MAYCTNCGRKNEDNVAYCPSCGTRQINSTGNQTYDNSYNSGDTGNMGWGVLGFFVPVAGLILFIVWKDIKPLTAKTAGKGALANVIVSFVFGLIGTCVAASGAYY